MPAEKDRWDKADIAAKMLIPLLVALIGGIFTYQQYQMQESRNTVERVINLNKSLSSNNPREQLFAITMLSAENQKHPNDVPDVLLSISLPDLIRLSDNSNNEAVANAAKNSHLN